MPNNTAPQIVGTYFRSLREDSRDNIAMGDLDVRGGPDLFQVVNNLSGQYGTFFMSAAGQWTYILDNSRAATQALENGDASSDWFMAHTADGLQSQIVIVTVRGARDVLPAPAATDAQVSLIGVVDHQA